MHYSTSDLPSLEMTSGFMFQNQGTLAPPTHEACSSLSWGLISVEMGRVPRGTEDATLQLPLRWQGAPFWTACCCVCVLVTASVPRWSEM